MKKKNRTRITLKDVATDAGVAVSTVSGILNRREDSWASEETRQRVFDAAEKLNYVPNSAARGLRLNRYGHVLVVLPDLSEPFFAELARRIRDELRGQNYETVYEETGFLAEQERMVLKHAVQRMIDGVIVATVSGQINQVLEETSRKLPLVHLGRLPETVNVDVVATDVGVGLRQALKHLYELGHRKVGFVDSHFVDVAARYERTRRLFKDEHFEFREAWRLHTSADLKEICACVEKWAGSSDAENGPTALICTGDSTAIAAMRGLRNAGVQVPEEMSIVGCNNIEMCDYLACPLTSICQPMDDFAENACRLLLKRIGAGSQNKAEHLFFPTGLVIRESTVPVSVMPAG